LNAIIPGNHVVLVRCLRYHLWVSGELQIQGAATLHCHLSIILISSNRRSVAARNTFGARNQIVLVGCFRYHLWVGGELQIQGAATFHGHFTIVLITGLRALILSLDAVIPGDHVVLVRCFRYNLWVGGKLQIQGAATFHCHLSIILFAGLRALVLSLKAVIPGNNIVLVRCFRYNFSVSGELQIQRAATPHCHLSIILVTCLVQHARAGGWVDDKMLVRSFRHNLFPFNEFTFQCSPIVRSHFPIVLSTRKEGPFAWSRFSRF